nr:MAG TPA: hypothetical protein [Caudoviricetes sp.]
MQRMIVAIILPALILFLFSPPHSGQNFAVLEIMCPQCSHGIKSFFGPFFPIVFSLFVCKVCVLDFDAGQFISSAGQRSGDF